MKSPDGIKLLATDRCLELSVFLMTSLHAVRKPSDVLSNMLLREFTSTSGLGSNGTQLPGNSGAVHQSCLCANEIRTLNTWVWRRRCGERRENSQPPGITATLKKGKNVIPNLLWHLVF